MTVRRNGKDVTASANLEQRQEWLSARDRAHAIDDRTVGNCQRLRIQLLDCLAYLLPVSRASRGFRDRLETFECGLREASPVHTPNAEGVPRAVKTLIIGVEIEIDLLGATEERDPKRRIADPARGVVQPAQDRVEI
jgi:hypothetical protein